jgi:hypothetical protein
MGMSCVYFECDQVPTHAWLVDWFEGEKAEVFRVCEKHRVLKKYPDVHTTYLDPPPT